MAANSIGIDLDLQPLIASIARAGAEIQAEAARRVQATAREAAGRVQTAIPYGTRRTKGKHLRDTVAIDAPRHLVSRVRVRAPHAHLYELGTIGRVWRRNGKSTGRMPAAHVMIPIFQAHRAAMYAAFESLVRDREL